MEDFTDREEKRKKEKNVYLLQLDTPRIIIITSVVIGIIVISLLIGMNINKEGRMDDIFSQQESLNTLPDNKLKLDIFKNKEIPSPLEEEMAIKRADIDSGSLLGRDDILKYRDIQKNNPSITEDEKNTTDILTNENIKDIIPPPSKVLKSTPKSSVKKKKKKSSKKIRRKRRTIEVASKRKKIVPSRANRDQYAMQVASFEKKSKALNQVENLERLRYDAHIEKAWVKGKKYYRVRIGPILSKRKAVEMLDDIHGLERYEESYIVKK